MKLRHVQATRYVTPLREGGSLPAIVEGDDSGMYVLKFHGAGQGPKVRSSVPTTHSYDYAVIRVVPRVERQEFVNAGVIVWCKEQDMLGARIELDDARLLALDPAADVAAVRRHLASIEQICAGGAAAGALGKLSKRERFDWLVAPRSTIIQTSPVHTGRCADMKDTLEQLLATMVRAPARAS